MQLASIEFNPSLRYDKYVLQIAIKFIVVQTVPNYKMVGNRKANVLGNVLLWLTYTLVQQRTHLHAGKIMILQMRNEICKCCPSIQNVVDNEDVSPFKPSA